VRHAPWSRELGGRGRRGPAAGRRVRDVTVTVAVGLTLLLAFGLASAEQWTVQTAAFQDHRQATRQIEELRALGFDAYTEFVMQEGRQYSRVRIGCFASRDAAVSFARDLRGRVTADAAAQPLGPAARPLACVEWEPGFVKPGAWRLVRAGSDVVFRVEVAGQVGFLQHDGSGWMLLHDLPSPPAADPSRQEERFRQVSIGGLSLAQARLPDGSRINACGGKLLWQRGEAAIVERASTVIACVVDDVPAGGAR
jgi:hypothetical protein